MSNPIFGPVITINVRATTKGRKYDQRPLEPQEVAQRVLDILAAERAEEKMAEKKQARVEAIERLRLTEIGRDVLIVLGID